MIMSWGLFPDKKNDSVDFVYAAHTNKENINGTFMPLVSEFHIGYVHPPFFSKFEIQLTDISLWYLFWFGNVFGFPLIGPPIVTLMYFMVQQSWFTLKTIWYFWYVLFIERTDPNYSDYTLGNWGYYLFLSLFL